jgi:hypothetical protein
LREREILQYIYASITATWRAAASTTAALVFISFREVLAMQHKTSDNSLFRYTWIWYTSTQILLHLWLNRIPRQGIDLVSTCATWNNPLQRDVCSFTAILCLRVSLTSRCSIFTSTFSAGLVRWRCSEAALYKPILSFSLNTCTSWQRPYFSIRRRPTA